MRTTQFLAGLILSIFVLSFICLDSGARPVARTRGSDGGTQLTGAEDHSISLTDAVKLTKNFQSTVPSNAVIAEYFGRNALLQMLNQTGCVGLRMYYGRRDDGTPALVLVGVDASGSDLVAGPLSENGYPCPPLCWTTSPLGR